MQREKPNKIQRGVGDSKLTPDWKRPLTCAIFLPRSSAKNKTVQKLEPGGRRTREFSLCRNDPKEKGAQLPEVALSALPGAPPRPWAGEIPRPAQPAPLLRGRTTPQLCARELLGSGSSSRSSPGRRRPLCWRARVGRCWVGPPPREGARVSWHRSPSLGTVDPADRTRRLAVRASPGPCPGRTTLFARRDQSPWAPGSALPRLPERGASGHLTARPVNQR